MREWKPGDVAMVNGDVCVYLPGKGWEHGGPDRFAYPSDSEARRLIIIDPARVHDDFDADRALESLPAWLHIAADKADSRDRDRGHSKGVGHGTILRNLATQIEAQTRDPKPAEPSKLGAVVEDGNSARFVRSDVETSNPWRGPDGTPHEWSEIDAVRVLTEGVQP